MNISYEITPADLRAFISHLFEQVCLRASLKKKGCIALTILMALSVAEQVVPSDFVEIGFSITFLGVGAAIVHAFVRTYEQGKYLLREPHGILCGEHELECRDGAIIERSPERETWRTWDHVSSVEEGPKHVGLIMKTPPCVWLPKNAFASQEDLAAFLQHARTTAASAAAKKVTETPRLQFSKRQMYHRLKLSRQQMSQGIYWIWKKQFWVIPTLLSLLGIGIYHYYETRQERVERRTTPAVAQAVEAGEGKSYFRVLPEDGSAEEKDNSKRCECCGAEQQKERR